MCEEYNKNGPIRFKRGFARLLELKMGSDKT
jgi:hypothetical protein